VKLGKNTITDACATLSDVYGGETVKNSSVFEWRKLFKEGHVSMEIDERSGRPRSHSSDEKVRDLAHSNRRLSTRAMGE
jgi:hypothetical protein